MIESSAHSLIARGLEEGKPTNAVTESRCGLPDATLKQLPIGSILAHLGKLHQKDIANILALQKQELQPFGRTAIKHNLAAEADVQYALSIQFGYPFVPPNAGYFRRDLRAAYDPFSEHVDDLRALRSDLLDRWLSPENKIVAIVSPRRAEGRSYLAANLAVVFAQLSYRTLLVDADLRFPSQHEIFKLANGTGLSSFLANRFVADDILKTVPVFGSLRLLVSGPRAPNPADLLTSPLFSLLLRKLKQRFDIILIDTPCNRYPEVANIASNADRILMVTRKHHTSVGAAKEVTTRLDGMSGKFIGCVLSCF